MWEEESQSCFPHESVGIAAADGNALGLSGSYAAVDTCSVIHAEGAAVLATYSDQYFAGTPAMTVNAYGKGRAYYLAARATGALLSDVYDKLVADLKIKRVLDTELPAGVTAQLRTDGTTRFVFLLNFNNQEATVDLGGEFQDVLTGNPCTGSITLERYGVRILSAPAWDV